MKGTKFFYLVRHWFELDREDDPEDDERATNSFGLWKGGGTYKHYDL